MYYEEQQTTRADIGGVEPLTLAQQKLARLEKSKNAKLSTITNMPVESEFVMPDRYTENTNQTGFIPSAKSSLLQAGGNLYDTAIDATNRLTDGTTTKDNTYWDSMSEQQVADQAANYDRTSNTLAMKDMSNQVSQANTQFGEGQYLDALGNYVGAAGTALGQVDELAGQSMGAMAELAGAAAVVGAIAKVAPKASKVLGWTMKTMPKAAVYGADRAHELAKEYEEATGEKKPMSEVAGDMAIASLLGVVELGVIGKGVANMTVGTFKNSMGHLAKTIDPRTSAFKSLSDTVWQKGVQIAQTAGAEAGQEFLETWHEIISGDKKSIGTQLQSKEGWDKAIVGSIAGLTTGGAIAAAPKAITLPAEVGISATRGVVDYGLKKGADISANMSYKVLPEADRQAIGDKYEAEDALHKEFTSQLDVQTKDLENLTGTKANLDAFMADPKNDIGGELHTAINSIQNDIKKREADGKPITDTVAKNIITKAIAANNAASVNSKAQLEASRAKDATYRLYSNTKKGVKGVVGKVLGSDTVKKGVEATKEAYTITKDFTGKAIDSTVDTAKNLDSSAARGYMEFIIDGRAGKGIKDSQITKQLNKVANKIPDTDLDTMIAVAKNDSKVKAALIKVRDTRKAAKINLGLLSDKVATIPKNSMVSKVRANTVTTGAQAKILFSELQTLANQKVIDPKVKAQFDVALGVLKKSKDITDVQYNTLSKRIKKNYVPDTIKDKFNELKEEVVNMDTDALKSRAGKMFTKIKDITKPYYDKAKPAAEKLHEDTKQVIKDFTEDQTKDFKSATERMNSGKDLGNATHRAITNITAAYIVSNAGNMSDMEGMKALYYEKYQDRVDAKVKSMTTVDENIYPMEAPSSFKHKDSTIQDIEDQVVETYNVEKVPMNDEDVPAAILALSEETVIC